MVHCCEKLFRDASLANMLLFTGNAFLGLGGLVLLLILDIISESDVSGGASSWELDLDRLSLRDRLSSWDRLSSRYRLRSWVRFSSWVRLRLWTVTEISRSLSL